MPENNEVALGVNANPINLSSTLGTLSQIQLSQAHAGLYGLQAQQEARKLAGLAYLKDNPTDYLGAIQQGLDPAVGSTLQTMGANERGYAATPGGLAPAQYQDLAGAGEKVAATRKIGAETTNIGTDVGAKIAQGVIADPSNDSVWQSAVDQHYQTFGGPTLERQQLLGVKDPAQRLQIAKAYAAQGVAPSTFGTPHNVPPTDAVTTPGASYGTPQAPTNRPGGPVPSSPKIMGDDEAVKSGLYSPTPEQQARGVVQTPNSRVAQGFGVAQPALTVGQAKENEGYGTEMAKALPALTEKANNSRQANFTLDQMRQESQSWDMGKGGTALATAQQYMKPFANALGSTVFDQPVADFESFQKNTGTLVRQAVKEVSPRAAVQEFQLIQNQLPSANMSRQGFNQIVNQFQAVNDFNIAKAQAGQAWRDSHGTMDKFETEWNKNVTPSAFLVSRLPPEQLGALKANLERTPEGRTTLGSINRQLQWASDNKLDELVQ